MSSSKFALQQLSKHGWKEGSGLGKSEDGITEAIKVKLKHDSHGVGHKKGDEFAFHWWDHVFNKAASNISVSSTEDGVELSKMKDSNKVSTTTSKTYDNKAMLYGKFLKGATLSGGNYESTNEGDSEDSEEHQEDTKPARIQDLDDAVLLKACGGMTGHKAARHGHKLNGKLARIQEQEALHLAKYKSQKTVIKDRTNVTEQGNPSVKHQEKGDDIVQTDNYTDVNEKKRKEKKKEKSERKKRKREMDESQCNIGGETIDTDISGIPTTHRCEEGSESEVQDTDSTRKKRKEKKRKNKEKSENVSEDIVCDEESKRKKKKDKKRKCEVSTTEDSISSVTDSKKKKKKEELKTQSCDDSETSLSKHSDECAVQDSRATKKKKSKKTKKQKSCD